MESKLSVEINGKNLNLPSDFSIDLEDVNPYFNDNESFRTKFRYPLKRTVRYSRM